MTLSSFLSDSFRDVEAERDWVDPTPEIPISEDGTEASLLDGSINVWRIKVKSIV